MPAPAATLDPQRRLAVATDPIGLVSGHYALSATYVVARRIGIRADVQILETQPGLIGTDGWRAGISAPIYLDRALHGPYIEPGLALTNRFMGYAAGIGTLGSSGAVGGASMTSWLPQHARSVEPQIFVGWQWLFGSGLHLAAAIGVSRHFATDGSGTSFSIPESYLRVGLAL